MATLLANNRRKVATSSSAGQPVVNDHDWDVQAANNNDYVEIGELPANHKLHGEGCALYGLLDANNQLAAQTMTVFVGNPGEEATANILFSAVAFTADTASRSALSTFLPAIALGSSPVNRKIYAKLTAAPATARGLIVARIATFPG